MKTPEVKTLAFRPEERNIFFHLLTGCNLACRHCYINREQHGTEMVSRETMITWLKLFYEPAKESNVIFLGGEPTMHPDLAFGIKKARELGYASVTVDTNGYLFHHLLERISPDDAVLSFSLDGPDAEVNDPIRGAGVFATCTANLQKAVGLGFKTSLIYTVSRLNLDHLPRMPELLADLGVNRFFIQVIGLRGKSAGDEAGLQLTPAEWLETVPAAAAKAAGLGIPTIYPKVFLDKGEKFECAGRVAENFFIFPNGRVYRCPLGEDHPIHSLEIKDDRLIKRTELNEDRFFELQIPEGCVMNRLLQAGNIPYGPDSAPLHRISCCLLKQAVGL
ncbi:MAG: radical SAM protein [Desulfurivibrionaceae bacterium]|nr:radical SAM protein [Desulfobulbales bacterium]MDT8335840.1 radical SAM protein [Desulfurivibrionaceae bacterium]